LLSPIGHLDQGLPLDLGGLPQTVDPPEEQLFPVLVDKPLLQNILVDAFDPLREDKGSPFGYYP
jgi:hypothetical protein